MKYSSRLSCIFCMLIIAMLSSCADSNGDPWYIGDAPNLNDGDIELAENNPDGDFDSEAELEIAAGELEPEAEPYVLPDEPKNRVVYELHGQTTARRPNPYNRLPYPYNYFTVTDTTTKTGIRQNLHLKANDFVIEYVNTNLIDRGLYLLNSERYLDAINSLDGFSAFAYMMFEIEPDIDTDTLPANPAESILDDSLIWVINIEQGDEDFGNRVPVWVKRLEAIEFVKGVQYEETDPSTYNHEFWYIGIRPLRPMKERTKYAVVVRKGLKTPDGEPLESSVNFKIISGMIENDPTLSNYQLLQNEKTRIKPLIDVITSDSIGIDKDDLLLAFDFTTQTITSDIFNFEEKLYNQEWGTAPELTFDAEKSGKFKFEQIKTDQQKGTVRISGTFKAVNFTLPYSTPDTPHKKGSFAYDDHGEVISQGEVDIPFILVLPTDETKQPYPVVILQHGIGSSKGGMLGLSGAYAEKGWASLSMDFIYHGERKVADPALDFADIVFPLKARAAFMQSAMEHIQLVRILKNYNQDIYPAGGDGKIDLSTDKIAYLGNSLGGIVGSVSIGASRDLGAAIINVGGGGLIDFVTGFFEDYGITSLYPDHYMKQVSTIIQVVLEPGDGASFAKYYSNPPSGFVEKSVILQESIDDETVPNVVTENLAISARLPHLAPIEQSIYGLVEGVAPVDNFGFTQFHPARHATLFDNSESGRNVRTQIIHFLETYFATGRGEVIVPQAE